MPISNIAKRSKTLKEVYKIQKMILQQIINALLNFLFPIECLGCKKEGVWLCKNCLSVLNNNLNIQITCPICNKKKYLNGRICHNCQKNFYLNKVLISINYENKLTQTIIKAYKYNFIRDLKKPLSEIMINYFKTQVNLINQSALIHFIVIPSPLSKKRFRWRGFNQSELLAQEIARYFNFTYLPNLIIKKKDTQEQAELSKKQRLINVRNSFQLTGHQNINGKSFLIIDDVITTGATLSEIARILKGGGAEQIWTLVIAKN